MPDASPSLVRIVSRAAVIGAADQATSGGAWHDVRGMAARSGGSPTGVLGGVLAGAAMAAVLGGCFLRSIRERETTGTCDGACEYYLDCKDADGPAARTACAADCRGVFGSSGQLHEFERLSCRDVVEFVDGIPPAPERS